METLVKKRNIQKNGTDVFITDEYEMFKHKTGNRPIDPRLVDKIYNSILENGWFESSIIIVGDGLCVLDGQHRIEALKKFAEKYQIRYKLKYMVDRNLDDLKKITIWQTARKGWTNMDYALSFIEQGVDDYRIYVEFMSKHKFPFNKQIKRSGKMGHSVALCLLGNSNNPSLDAQRFKRGKIKIFNIDLADKFANRLKEIYVYFPHATHSMFARVMVSLWNNPLFDHDEFMNKLIRNREMLFRCATSMQYYRTIEDIYNYGRREKSRVSLIPKVIKK